MPVKSSHRVCGDPYFHSKCLHISWNSRLCNIFHRMPSLTANCPDGPILIFHPHRMLNLLRVFFYFFDFRAVVELKIGYWKSLPWWLYYGYDWCLLRIVFIHVHDRKINYKQANTYKKPFHERIQIQSSDGKFAIC